MNQATTSTTERCSNLLLELETDCGTTDLCTLVFKTLRQAIADLKVEDITAFKTELESLYDLLSHTKPRFGIINYYLNQLKKFWEQEKTQDLETLRKHLESQLEQILDEIEQNKADVLDHINELPVEGKTILIYDHSHTVHKTLKYLHQQQKRKFKVIVAEQDYCKTHENIEVLHDLGIPFRVVPDYMLCHIHEEIDAVFLGATTLKDTMHFVMDPGTYSLVSQFNSFKIPCYLFCCTSKFSLWPSKHLDELSFKQDQRAHPEKEHINYERLKYSHDRVKAEHFTKIVTDEGMFTPEEIEEVFAEKLKAFGHQ